MNQGNHYFMLQFVIYGIENEKYNRLLKELRSTMEEIPMEYEVAQVHDVDEIIRSGVIAIPSLYHKNTLIVEENIPESVQLKQIIGTALADELKPDQVKYFKS